MRTSTDLILLRCTARMTPERRRVALVRYDESFARWQALQDPLYKALVSLHREITSAYKDVPAARGVIQAAQ